MSGAVYPLQGNQLKAADPRDNIWLSASAGTGKTQVLSARVLRLLLTPGVEPSQILCLTFTKAGAAEMANRINAVLARWVRLDAGTLAKELKALGAAIDPKTQAHARTLFASVLDCPGGGLRIDTIHAFSQWLLANFPEEADLTPGARPMEDRERELLARDVLTEMLSEGDARLNDAVSHFARVKDPDALRGWLMRCASASQLWQGKGAWQPPMAPRVQQLLGIPAGADARWAEEVLHAEVFPDAQVTAMLPLMRDWNTKYGQATAEFLPQWLSADMEQRAELVGNFYQTVLIKNGNPRKMAKPAQAEPNLPAWQDEIAAALALYRDRRALLALADFLTPALEMGRAFALRWEAAKVRGGYLDFDDLIHKAATLLGKGEAAEWIRYKLDRSFDHIMIDEAQDTNAAQWDIVFALIDDFFSGEGARGDKIRTIFTVGDYKQAIFGFQGTSPDNFERAKSKVEAAIKAAKTNAHELRENRRLPEFDDPELGRSFRTSEPVLRFVNQVIDALGFEAFGLPKAPDAHEGDDRAGLVALWQPVMGAADNLDDDHERDWLPAHDTEMADRIAQQVSRWVDPKNANHEPFVLEKGKRRHARAGDIMVLVRKRKDLANQIVAKLHARGVAVAGVDRLRLGAPLAVKDLMAALRFAAQPLDDLSLANLLASPLIGWSQGDLLAFVPRDEGVRLWDHIRKHEDPFVRESADTLRALLRLADYETPQALLAWLLTGPWGGRAKLVARLGREANDPIDELVNAAFAYQSAHVPSLAGFIEWFDAGEGELKRDADEADAQVRVMTVHGSKGLQRPIVILADATGGPSTNEALELADDPLGTLGDAAPAVPLPSLSADERVGPVAKAEEKAEIAAMQEHWRLLYVAMTRAEEALFIGGSLGPRQAKKGEPHEDSWYAKLLPVFDTPPLEDAIWGSLREWGMRADPLFEAEETSAGAERVVLPTWATTPIGEEPRPPRPLAPSNAGEEQGSDPPLEAEVAAIAARRGVLIHRLLERLPDIAPDTREKIAQVWLERQAQGLAPEARAEMLGSALKVLDHPAFGDIFAPGALAEVPLTATVGGVVVTGIADRLLVNDDTVTVVDFKTTRRPPQSLEDVPLSTQRQMAAYHAALSVIYPDKNVRCAVLYTHQPTLFEIPAVTLEAHKDRLGRTQDNYAPQALE
ncbi:MAG: double-strand break repair helicase AddA [Pseudomonadota bacterium]